MYRDDSVTRSYAIHVEFCPCDYVFHSLRLRTVHARCHTKMTSVLFGTGERATRKENWQVGHRRRKVHRRVKAHDLMSSYPYRTDTDNDGHKRAGTTTRRRRRRRQGREGGNAQRFNCGIRRLEVKNERRNVDRNSDY